MTAQKPTLEVLEKWFLIAWEPPTGATFVSLADYVKDKFPSEAISFSPSPDETFEYKMLREIGKKLHKCPARCPKQLRKWAYREIDKIAAKLKKDRSGKKKMPYELHGDKVFISVTDSNGRPQLWIIPAGWIEWALKLSPYVRRYPDGRPYLARKVPVVQPDGTTVQVEAAVHRLFMGLRAVPRHNSDAAEVRAKDGNLLNFCDGNLEIVKGRDLLDVCSFLGDSIGDLKNDDDWVPAQPRRTETEEGRDGRNWHERAVQKWLGGGWETDDCELPDEPQVELALDDLFDEQPENREDFYE